jgi:hypothetical protein
VTVTPEQDAAVLDILRQLRLDGLFSQPAQRDFLFHQLAHFGAAYEKRVADEPRNGLPPNANLETILSENLRNPQRVEMLFQALAFKCTPEILVMIWMTLLGSRIQSLSYEYGREQKSALTVTLLLPDQKTELRFESTEHWDAAVLRFTALSKANDQPMIEDFHPMWIPPQDNPDDDLRVRTPLGDFAAVDTAATESIMPRWEIRQVFAKMPSRPIGTVVLHAHDSVAYASNSPSDAAVLEIAWNNFVRKYGRDSLKRRPAHL